MGEIAEPSESPVDARSERLDAAAKILKKYVGLSAAAGAVPFPVVDVAGLAIMQTKMVAELAELYGQRMSAESVRTVVGVLAGILLPKSGASMVGHLLAGTIPGGALLINAASMSAFSGAASYALGKVLIRHFEHGGTMQTLSVGAIRQDLEREFKAAAEPKAAAAA